MKMRTKTKTKQRELPSPLLFLIPILGAACGTRAAAPPRTSALEAVRDSGEVVIGIGQDAAPFGYREGDDLVGFDFDIARAVVARLEAHLGRELKIRFKAVTDETRIGWVQSGEVHMSLCHTNCTRKRDARIDFTVPYGWDGKGVLYALGRGERDLAAFAGATIGIKRSSSSQGEIEAWFEGQGLEQPTLKVYDNHAAGIRALVDGQIDGFTDDNSIIINTAMRAGHGVGPSAALNVTKTSYSRAQFGIGLPENDSDWRDVLNYSLHDLWNDREFQAIYERWFGADSMCPIPLGQNRMEPFVIG